MLAFAKKPVSILFMTTFLFLSCNFESYISLSLEEIQNLIRSKEKKGILFPATIKLEVSGTESCERDKVKITDYVNDYLIEPKDGVCTNDSDKMKTYLEIEGKVKLVNDESLLADDIHLVSFSAIEKDKELKLSLHLNDNSFQSISAFTQREFWAKLEPKDLSIQIYLSNNTNRDMSMNCRSCYLNGTPKPFRGTTNFPKDTEVTVKLSTIFVESILENGNDTVVSFQSKDNLETQTKSK